jgi:hypothetical protein
MMTVAIVALALAVLALTLVLLVLIGTQREAPWSALDTTPPTPLAAFSRKVLGVYIRKPATSEHIRRELAATQPRGGETR